jgi:CarD family transcriptional regulator
MYKIGDFIHYGNTGVCKVTDIVTHELPRVDKDQLFYVLKPLHQSCIISTPVNTKKVFMRPIISKAEAERLIDMIPSIPAKAYHNHSIQLLSEHYETALKSHDCADLIKLGKSIHAKKQEVEQQNRKFGVVDERFMKRAEELLFGELAVALGIPKDKVPDYIAEKVHGEMEGKQQ